jgi:cell filamentation protein
MDALEAQKLLRALKDLAGQYGEDHRFTAVDVCRMHETWLGGIYPWAGQYRQVNISKGSFPFAASAQIPRLMDDFEKNILRRHTPCRSNSRHDMAYDLAIVHTELVLIHPFREGNGRVARLLAVLMALQTGLPPLDFGLLKGKKRQGYFAAVQAGMDRNYEPMTRIFSEVIDHSLKTSRPFSASGTTRR